MFNPGEIIDDRYRVLTTLKGGMGYVFICEDLGWEIKNKPVKIAVKTPLPQVRKKPGVAQRFINEAKLWVELGKHPNIVQAYYVKNIQDIPFIFMEFVQSAKGHGPDLTSWIDTDDLDLNQSLHFAAQFCNGMVFATKCFEKKGLRFLHRDIKPGNTLISHKHLVKITDFGLAKASDETDMEQPTVIVSDQKRVDSNLTMKGAIIGSPGYMSPEQFANARNVDIRSDVYAFGCMFYAMLTRRLPFMGKTLKELKYKHTFDTPTIPSQVKKGIPSRIDNIIIKCMSKKPEHRYQDFSLLLKELSDVMLKFTGVTLPTETTDPISDSPKSIGQKLDKSMSYMELGQKKEALKLFAEAIGENPLKKYDKSPAGTAGINAPRHLVRGGLASDTEAMRQKAPERPGKGSQTAPAILEDFETVLVSKPKTPTEKDEDSKTVIIGRAPVDPEITEVEDE